MFGGRVHDDVRSSLALPSPSRCHRTQGMSAVAETGYPTKQNLVSKLFQFPPLRIHPWLLRGCSVYLGRVVIGFVDFTGNPKSVHQNG